MPDTFTCSACGETFAKDWSDHEAADELARDFPEVKLADCNVICDDCHQQFTAWLARQNRA